MSEQRIIPFMKYRFLALGLSGVLILLAIVSLAWQGLNFGLDFTGGTSIEVVYEQPAEISEIRERLDQAGYPNAVIKYFGAETDVLISVQREMRSTLADEITEVLRAGGQQLEVVRVNFIGPQVGDDLRDQGGIGMIAAWIAVMLYVSMRFQFKFALASVLALAHDVVIILGLFSLFRWDFDLTVLAAILAVIGYSINDTIVVFDRIREDVRIMRKAEIVDIVDAAVTETMSRTLVTSFTTALVLLALFIFGGSLIHGFATALLIGVFVGTYSSIFTASALVVQMKATREDLLPPEKEGEEFESLP